MDVNGFNGDLEKSPAWLEFNMQLPHGVAIPNTMTRPGADSYRSPTGEHHAHYHSDPVHLERAHAGHRSPFSHIDMSHAMSSPPGSAAKSHFSLHRGLEKLEEKLEEKLSWRERIRHFTWSFFTLTMATGGIANILYSVPYRLDGIESLGTFFFLLNLVFFVIIVGCISLRFAIFPETFKASLTHPTESLFVPAAFVSLGTILINVSQYGIGKTGAWLDTAILVLFWLDVALAIIASSGIYLIMWSTQTFTIAEMTPIWIFPAYPLLIIGPFAAVVSSKLDPSLAADILVGGFTIQGIGYMVTLMIYSAFIYRLMTQKLPKENMRPGMFVSVGPSGFTASALIGMAANAERALGHDFMGNGPLAAMILRVVANWAALWLWGLALWFFFIAVGAHWSCMGHGGLKFAMSWFSFVFPNTALVSATFAVGKAFNSIIIQILGCVLTCILIAMWFLVVMMMIRAIILKQILWPQKGEDKDEGGFKASERKKENQEVQADLWERNGASTNPV